jgi:hypothetical protein
VVVRRGPRADGDLRQLLLSSQHAALAPRKNRT